MARRDKKIARGLCAAGELNASRLNNCADTKPALRLRANGWFLERATAAECRISFHVTDKSRLSELHYQQRPLTVRYPPLIWISSCDSNGREASIGYLAGIRFQRSCE